jgi:uncharacterized membrane protein
MTNIALFSTLGQQDLSALAFLVVVWLAAGWVIEHPPTSRPSVSVLMASYRRDWMRHFVTRDPRIFDSGVMEGLRQGTAFFASACIIAIGGGLALVGNADPIRGLATDLALNPAPSAVLEIRVLVVIVFLTNAVLKFIWSHRLFGYCLIVMASAPNEVDDPMALHRALQAAEINISAAKGFNRGLRSVYFALGALGWLLGPGALVLTTSVTLAVLLRREFASVSREVILDRGPTRG